jgi:hypothetical protein
VRRGKDEKAGEGGGGGGEQPTFSPKVHLIWEYLYFFKTVYYRKPFTFLVYFYFSIFIISPRHLSVCYFFHTHARAHADASSMSQPDANPPYPLSLHAILKKNTHRTYLLPFPHRHHPVAHLSPSNNDSSAP